MNGDGQVDFLYAQDWRRRLVDASFTYEGGRIARVSNGGALSDLLMQLDNGRGGITQVT